MISELAPWLENESIEDLVIKPSGLFFFEKNSWHGPYETTFKESIKLKLLAQLCAENVSLSLQLTQPIVDSILHWKEEHFFRVHIAIEPFLQDGPEITLRRVQRKTLRKFSDLEMMNTQREELIEAVQRGANIMVCGATASGKTTFLNLLLSQVSKLERCLILEDAPEIILPNALSTRLLTRSNRFKFREGAHWSLEDLLFESLRMRPDRLILGECRGPEAKAIFRSLQTGHKGIFTSIHAGSAKQALSRFADLAGLNERDRTQSSELWDYVLLLKHHDGRRQLLEVLKRPS